MGLHRGLLLGTASHVELLYCCTVEVRIFQLISTDTIVLCLRMTAVGSRSRKGLVIYAGNSLRSTARRHRHLQSMLETRLQPKRSDSKLLCHQGSRLIKLQSACIIECSLVNAHIIELLRDSSLDQLADEFSKPNCNQIAIIQSILRSVVKCLATRGT